MKRILQVVRRMNYGGLETLIMNIYRNIDKQEFQFDFIVDQEGKYDDEIRKMGGKIFYIPYITKVGLKNYEKRLRLFFKEHKEYQIVHSHLDQVSGIIMKAAFLENVPIRISHSHNTNNTNNFLGRTFKKYLQSMIGKYANNLFACSENAGKWLFGKRQSECYILNNGIDVEKFKFSIENRNKIRNELNITPEEEIWGHIGRMSKQKNQNFLIDVFAKYQKYKNNSKLLLIGEGKLKNKIERKVRRLGLEDKVTFLGVLNNPEEYYSAFDLIVFPSLFEGLSLVMIEAQISGVPIIASTNIDKATDVTKTMNYISLKKSPDEWAKYIKQNISKQRQEKNIEKVIKSGYGIKEVTKKLANKYDELLKIS